MLKTPSALVARIERPDVVPDVVSDDHAVPHIVEKPDQRLLFLHPSASLVARDAVHGDGARVLGHFQEHVEGVLEHDLVRADGDGADRDEAIGLRIQSGRLGVEHDETHLIDRRLIGPGGVEARSIAVDE